MLEAHGRLQRAPRLSILSALEAAAAALSEIKAIDALCVHFVGLAVFFICEVADRAGFTAAVAIWVTQPDAFPKCPIACDAIADRRMWHLEWNASQNPGQTWHLPRWQLSAPLQ